jgi:hypothetical protein
MYLLVVLGIHNISSQNARAQVKIGTSNEDINQGASLEVESGPYPGNIYRGLLFPKIALPNYTTWSLTGSPTDGMVIFNTATTSGDYAVSPGIYCWYNFQWNRQSPANDSTKPALITSVDCQPGVAAVGPYNTALDLTASYPYLNQAKQIIVVPGSAGPYNFFTSSTSNNIQFRATGTFTTAQVGTPQAISLRPNGTAGATGISSFTVVSPNVNNSYNTSYCSFAINTTNAVDCSGPLAGIYKVGTPLDASNTKQVTFTPPAAGDYTFTSFTYEPVNTIVIPFYFIQTVTFSAAQVGSPQTVTIPVGIAYTPTHAVTLRASLIIKSPALGITYQDVCSYSVPIAP